MRKSRHSAERVWWREAASGTPVALALIGRIDGAEVRTAIMKCAICGGGYGHKDGEGSAELSPWHCRCSVGMEFHPTEERRMKRLMAGLVAVLVAAPLMVSAQTRPADKTARDTKAPAWKNDAGLHETKDIIGT